MLTQTGNNSKDKKPINNNKKIKGKKQNKKRINDNNSEPLVPTFLRVKKCLEINENGTAVFETIDGTKETLEYISIADCSFDTIFKSIFYIENVSEYDIDGGKRLMSLLNGLFFPDSEKNDLKIREIRSAKGETVKFNEKFNKGTVRYDVPSICKCWCEIEENNNNNKRKLESENQKVYTKEYPLEFGVDIEMQIKYEENIGERFFRYNSALNFTYDKAFVVISLLNFRETNYFSKKKDSQKDEGNTSNDKSVDNKNNDDPLNDEEKNKKWVGVGPAYFTPENKLLSLLDDILNNTYYINLKHDHAVFIYNSEFKLTNKRINNTATAWLKLFSVRHWSKKDPTNVSERYVIPKDMNGLDKEVIDAINILRCVTQPQLTEAIENQRHLLKIILKENKKAEKKGRKKGREEGRKEGIEIGEKKATKKANLNSLICMVMHGINLDECKDVTEGFTNEELENIKIFMNEPYDINEFANDLNMEKQDVLNILERYNIKEIKPKR